MSYNKETGMYEGYIYLITNKINDKKYVGQTTTTIEHRMTQHFSKTRKIQCRALHGAIKKYGRDNFDIKELEILSCDTKETLVEKLNEKEISYIKEYHSHVNEHGYNISEGGFSHSCIGRAVDVYDIDGQFIQSFDSMSEASRFYNVAVHVVNGMCDGTSCRSRITDYIFRYKGEPFDKYDTSYIIGGAKTVYQFDLDGNFIAQHKSLLDAEKSVNPNYNSTSGSDIGASIKNNKTSRGYVWSYDKEFRFNPEEYRNWSAVDQYSMNGEFLNTYNSLTEAAYSIGKTVKNVSNISSVCSGKTFNAYGFVWRYKGEPFNKYPSKRIYTNNRPVDQYTRDGIFVASYDSAKIASIKLNLQSCTSITSCCKGKIKTAFDYVWRYKGHPFDEFKTSLEHQIKINQYTIENVFVKTHLSSVDAMRELNVSSYGSIKKCCRGKLNTYKGYKWFFANDPNQPDETKIIA